ncbi:hypothetical protein V22_25720 [Calycomorphotria hydatis]|uniref:Uncharacterized protein n=1 Tax=Calycomorphotria hydatis TaxID=2528027 RepID=A0A517TAC7_9PLAN|nr:hypothetical protein V22_25720 [Calycomorphotria hydatis]
MVEVGRVMDATTIAIKYILAECCRLNSIAVNGFLHLMNAVASFD